ncbi:alpha-N-arabinofuranosidase [Sphingomonas crusticola]|uniref:alpha-N-arabinofuranosidase n=1 Tax=Sphingomonas crusticola TaxID=1697973 RepID=UPI00196877E5|nr:alpha-L-arabinofuranosidase C-terminal domain-containing protein [Sphingomonas crusticola]
MASALAPASAQTGGADATLVIHGDQPGPIINRQVFSQFAEHLGHGIYEGVWVGRNSKIPNVRGYRSDVVDALKALSVPVVRWPGGCFADEYHWRDGVGAPNKRPVKVNTHWGGVTEPNSFGTDEYMGFVDLIGAEPYISGNVGDAPPREMAEWIEYITSPTGSSLAQERAANGHKEPWKLPYFGIGNELWGCGGNMRAEYAADVTRRYATFIKAPAGTRIMKFASGANTEDYDWTDTMMRIAGSQIDGITLHYYTFPGGWEHKGSATQFDENEWAMTLKKTLRMEELITRHSAVMDKYDPQKRVWLVVDEWGTWYDAEPGTNPGFLFQQNSLRDALVAAININIFAKHADRVKMTAIAQMINVLQAMILTDGPKMVLTPTYHVFKMYKPWQDATNLPIELKSPWYNKGEWTMPGVSASAVRDKAGQVHIGLANLDPNKPATVSTTLAGISAASVSGTIITASAMNAINSFDQPNVVVPQTFTGAQVAGGTLTVTLPPKSVVVLDLQ